MQPVTAGPQRRIDGSRRARSSSGDFGVRGAAKEPGEPPQCPGGPKPRFSTASAHNQERGRDAVDALDVADVRPRGAPAIQHAPERCTVRRRGFVGYAQLLSSCTVQVHLEQLRILSQRSGRVRRSHERALSEGAPSERAEERAVVGRVRLVFAHRANFILVGGQSGTVGQSVARRGRGERESGPSGSGTSRLIVRVQSKLLGGQSGPQRRLLNRECASAEDRQMLLDI